jgi:hypothetical protein
MNNPDVTDSPRPPATSTPASGSVACVNCNYWRKQSVESGECRRRAPQVVAYTESQTKGEHGEYRESVDSYTRSEWPNTLAEEWCGEYEPLNGALNHGEEPKL